MGNKKELIINVVKEVLLNFDPVEFGDEDAKDRLDHISNLIADKLVQSETI